MDHWRKIIVLPGFEEIHFNKSVVNQLNITWLANRNVIESYNQTAMLTYLLQLS